MAEPPRLFDRDLHRLRLARAAAGYEIFLKVRAADDLVQRLAMIRRSFPVAVELGARTGTFAAALSRSQAAGQIGWLTGYCHPIRFNDLAKNSKVPADLMAKLPDPALYAKAVFPTLDEQSAASAVITKQWDTVVGANVK